MTEYITRTALPTSNVKHILLGCIYTCFVVSCSPKPTENDPKLVPNSQTSTAAHVVRQRDLYYGNRSTLADQTQNGFKPRKDLKHWQLALPIDWAMDPFRDRNWQFQLNAWRMLDPYLKEYFRTEDSVHLDEALNFIRDWHKFHIIEGKDQHKYSWYDMGKGIRGLYIAYFLSADQEGTFNLSDADRLMLLELAERHVEKTHEIGISDNNHGIFQVAGLSLICQVVPAQEFCEGEISYAQEKALHLMRVQFTESGIHKENSPAYHFFARNVVKKLPAFKSVVNPGELARINENSKWLVFPNRRISAIGDSSGKSNPLVKDLNKQCLTETACYSVAPFESDGYAIIRDLPSNNPESMLFVSGMAHNTVHSHQDALTFELMEFGRMIFVDSGKYGYLKDDNRRYVQSAKAHNTISLNNQSYSLKDMELVGSQLEEVTQENDAFTIHGKAKFSNYFEQAREFIYTPKTRLKINDTLVPFDRVTKNSETEFVSSLHFSNVLLPTLTKNGFELNLDGKKILGTLETKGCKLSLTRGQSSPRLGWESVGYLKMTPASVVQAHCEQSTPKISWDIQFNQ